MMLLNFVLLVQVASFVTASGPHIGRAVEGGTPFLSSVADCMTTNSPNLYMWESIVDFIAHHSTWYDQYINQQCNSLSAVSQAACWGSALEYLIDPALGDLAIFKGCVCDYYQQETGESVCPNQRRKRAIPGRRPTLDSADCPHVDRGLFTQRLVSEVGASVNETDRTFYDFESVIQFISQQGKCEGLCDCSHVYHNAFDPSKNLMCESCWPTRLYSLTKESSILSAAIEDLVISLEFADPPVKTNITCFGNSVYLDVGHLDLHTIEFLETDDLVVWNTSVMIVSEVDPQCRVTTSNTLVFPLGECRPNLTVINEDTVQYEYTIWKVTNFVGTGAATRASQGVIIATCSYTKNLTVDFTGRFLPLLRTISLNTSAMGNFMATLSFFNMDFTTAMASGFEVEVPDWLNPRATLHLDGPDPLHLLLVECWATPTSNASDKHRYDLINDYCPSSEMYNGEPAVEIIQNGKSKDADFRFRSFVWAHDFESQAYVHCAVSVCNSNITGSCNNCTLRKKRTLQMEKDVATKLVSVGPVTIRDKPKKNLCDDNNGDCPELCEVINEKIRCSCFPGRQRSKDGSICVDPDDSPKATFGQNLIVFLMAANVGMFVAAFVINRRKWE